MLSGLARHFRVLGLFWGAALAAEMEYRANFIVASLSSLGNLIGSIFSLFLFYRTGYTFQNWSWEEALVVLGMFMILQGLANTFLAPNLNKIVRHVQDGTLDFILLKPISSQFQLSFRTLSPWGLPDLFFGCGIVLFAGDRLGIPISAYAIGLVPLTFGIISLYSLWFILGATSVWFVKIYNVTEVLRGLLEAGRYPVVAYPAIYRVFFTFIIPVAFLTTIPAEAIVGRTEVGWTVGSAILAGGLLAIANRFWRFALRFYTSASS